MRMISCHVEMRNYREEINGVLNMDNKIDLVHVPRGRYRNREIYFYARHK